MKNYHKSDYALNKFSEGIVYQFSDGTLEISMADYLRDNPNKTEADFWELKALSDEIYLEQVRLETAQGNKTGSIPHHPWMTVTLWLMRIAASNWRWTSCFSVAS